MPRGPVPYDQRCRLSVGLPCTRPPSWPCLSAGGAARRLTCTVRLYPEPPGPSPRRPPPSGHRPHMSGVRDPAAGAARLATPPVWQRDMYTVTLSPELGLRIA